MWDMQTPLGEPFVALKALRVIMKFFRILASFLSSLIVVRFLFRDGSGVEKQ